MDPYVLKPPTKTLSTCTLFFAYNIFYPAGPGSDYKYTTMLIHELTENLASTLVKGAAAVAKSVDTYKLRAILGNMRPLDRLPPNEARQDLYVMIGNLKKIELEIPQVADVIKFIEQQQNNPQSAQVLQMAVSMLRKIVG